MLMHVQVYPGTIVSVGTFAMGVLVVEWYNRMRGA